MTEKLVNYAAWQPYEFAKALEVREGPSPQPQEDEVVVKVFYVGIAPSDWKMQEHAYLPLNYPHVTGSDVSGVVVQTGSAKSKFKLGDRVMGFCAGVFTKRATDGAFQHYATVKSILVSSIPASLPLANAVVLPMAINTAASGLYCVLGLPLPALDPVPNGKTLLIWGGSSSIGSATIQLAIASGFKVITTASPNNFDYVKTLGAAIVFDHGRDSVVEEIISAFQGENFGGAFDAIGLKQTTEQTATILSKLGGGKLPSTLWPPKRLPENVNADIINAFAPGFEELHIGETVLQVYVPLALSHGTLKALPEPHIVKGGLERIQHAIALQKAGVSAKKIVVEIVEEV